MGLLLIAVCPFCQALSDAEAVDLGPILRAHLMQRYPWPDIEMADLAISGKTYGGLPENIRIEKGPPGRTVFLLEFGNGERITATADVKAFDRIVLSRRPLRKGHHIDGDDIYESLMDIGRIPKGAVKDPGEIRGKTLARSVVANCPIVDVMVNDAPVVKKGSRVVLTFESDGFIAKTAGELRESSSVGSHVKAVNITSKKTVTGTLMDEKTVRVDY